MYQAIFVNTWPWWVGGILIGLLVPALYYFHNTALGVSTGYGNLVKIISRSRLPWLQGEKFLDKWGWRVFFIVGMILGAFIAGRFEGRPVFSLEMPLFTEVLTWPFLGYAVFFFTGGLFLGLGARIAGGCTSGHSIHGIANLHKSSIIVTIVFLIFGAIAAAILRAYLLGGGGL